jgi:hypothetical protein
MTRAELIARHPSTPDYDLSIRLCAIRLCAIRLCAIRLCAIRLCAICASEAQAPGKITSVSNRYPQASHSHRCRTCRGLRYSDHSGMKIGSAH